MNRVLALIAVVLAAACSSTPRPTPTPTPTPTDEDRPPAPAATIDSGAFLLSINGVAIGDEQFTITVTGGETSVTWANRLAIGKALDVSAHGTVVVDPSWRPLRGDIEVVASGTRQAIALTRENGAFVARASGQTIPEKTPSDLYLANNTMVLGTAFCALAGEHEKTLSAFPGVEVRIGSRVLRPFARAIPGKRDSDVPTFESVSLYLVDVTVGGTARNEVVCDDDNKLIALHDPLQGFGAVREGWSDILTILVAAQRTKPALPAGFVDLERKVTVPAKGEEPEAVLACSLLLPESYQDLKKRSGKGKDKALPAVLFLTGSGPQDRDEDTPGPGGLKLAIFKHLAIALAQAGVASLRCDDRGVAESTGGFAAVTVDTFTRDAVAMLAALRAEPAIDPKRTGVLGHSEGAVVALAVAAADASLAALALMAGTGRPLDEVILDQIEWKLRADKASDAEIAEALAMQREIYARLRDGKPLPADLTAAQREAITAAAAWLKSHMATDPAALARKVSKKTAVLIAQGDKDFQVLVKDAEKLRDALAVAKVKRVTYKIYPGLNHLFSLAKTGSLADYTDPDAKVDAGFIADVSEFLAKAL